MSDAPGWDLSQAYESGEHARSDAQELSDRCRRFADEVDALLAAGDATRFVETLGALEQDVAHLRDYGRMLQYADAGGDVELVTVLLSAAGDAEAELARALDSWCALPADRASALLADRALATARHPLSLARALHESRLSPAEERVWAARQETGRTRWEGLHEQVEASVRVEFERDAVREELGLGQLSSLARHPDRETRRRAYVGLADGYRGIADLVAACWDASVADRLAEDRLRGHDHPAAATLATEELAREGFESLLAATAERVSVRQALHRPQARILGVERLQPCDLDAEPAGLPTLGWRDAWDAAAAGLGRVAPALTAEAHALLAAGRVDLQQRPGKQAYAVTFATRTDPPAYLSSSFGGRIANATTIGHELGHAVALGAMRRTQPPISRGWPGVAFEVPSYLGELSSGDELVARADAGQRDGIRLVALQDLMWAVFESLAFCRAELELYRDRAAGRPLTAERILDALGRHMGELLGSELAPDEDDALVWMASWAGYAASYRFYNFQYAVGALTALAILARGRDDPTRLAAEVETFLARGRSASPAEQLAPFGLDLGGRALWDEGLDELERRVRELTQLSG